MVLVAPSTVTRILATARNMLAGQGAWTQGAEARESDGRPTHPTSDRAVAWSDTGAIYAASGYDGSPERRQGLVAALVRYGKPHGWNDEPTREVRHVMSAFDDAIRNEAVERAPRA